MTYQIDKEIIDRVFTESENGYVLDARPSDTFNKVVLKALSPFKMSYGGNSRHGHNQELTIPAGDLFILDDRARDGTRWIYYNFERGEPWGRVNAEVVGELDFEDKEKVRGIWGKLIGVYMSTYIGKLDWQEELRKIVRWNNE
jgi:hypothetical protein